MNNAIFFSFQVVSCPKGQVEVILQVCNTDTDTNDNLSTNPKPAEDNSKAATTSDTKNRWKFGDVTKKISEAYNSNKRDKHKGLCFKITTSKMRCSIKVKEEFENIDAQIYVKTTIFEHDILSNSWKSDQFSPSLSIRWNAENSTITIPINEDTDLQHISIKVSTSKFSINIF